MRWVLSSLLAVVLLGCGSNERMPYVGKWDLRFTPTRDSRDAKADDLKRFELIGYLQVYATKNQYILHLEGEQQIIEMRGEWKLDGKRLVIRPGELTFELRSGIEERDPNKVFIAPDLITKAYAQDLVFDLSEDGRSLTGLTMAMGPLRGEHRAKRGGSGTVR